MYRKVAWIELLVVLLLSLVVISVSACGEQPPSPTPTDSIPTGTQTSTPTPPNDVPDPDDAVTITSTMTPTRTSTATRIALETPTLIPTPTIGPVMPLSGDGIVRITDGVYNYFLGSLNPEQTELIAFAQDGSDWRLVRIDPDQGGLIEFITDPGDDYLNPQVSPNGAYILAASSYRGVFYIVLLDYPNGESARRKHSRSSSTKSSSGAFPDWFPDGERYVFISNDGDREVSMKVLSEKFSWNQGSVVQLTFNTSQEYSPHVSPDGEYIVYYSSRENNVDIYVYSMEDKTETRLTTDRARDAEGTFSPDGEWIVFESDRTGNNDIWAVRTDGSDLQQITSDSANEQVPYFSRDGEWLFYQRSEDGGNYDIYRIPWDK